MVAIFAAREDLERYVDFRGCEQNGHALLLELATSQDPRGFGDWALERPTALRKLLGSRYELSLLLIVGSLVLLVAIVIGDSMGNKVLGQIASRASTETTPVPIPTASAGDEASQVLARRREVLSVATDPAFPDPRITPEPPPPATPRPPSPSPKPSPTEDDGGTPDPSQDYTSPPLAIPLESQSPGAEASPEDTASPHDGQSPGPHQLPGRGFPSLPPNTPQP
jgi:hypothetical protein